MQNGGAVHSYGHCCDHKDKDEQKSHGDCQIPGFHPSGQKSERHREGEENGRYMANLVSPLLPPPAIAVKYPR